MSRIRPESDKTLVAGMCTYMLSISQEERREFYRDFMTSSWMQEIAVANLNASDLEDIFFDIQFLKNNDKTADNYIEWLFRAMDKELRRELKKNLSGLNISLMPMDSFGKVSKSYK